MMYFAVQYRQPHKDAIDTTIASVTMSQGAEIKALVAGLIEASILYVAMTDDNERKEVKTIFRIINGCYS